MNTTIPLENQALHDFDIFQNVFRTQSFAHQPHFSASINTAIDNILSQEARPPITQTILHIHKIIKTQVRKQFPFLSLFQKKPHTTTVTIVALADYYWIVDGKESAIPSEQEPNDLWKQREIHFSFGYTQSNDQWTLVAYWDDIGTEL